MASETLFALYPAFKLPSEARPWEPEIAAKEIDALLEEYSDRVTTRGVYSTTGFRADTDFMFWWVAPSVDDLQSLAAAFGRTEAGRGAVPTHSFLGLVRPAEFARDHLPAFVRGEPPKKYACVYPFVRTPDWYLLAPSERAELLREHGEAGREFPEVLANTTSAFGLGDYEWILAFEADGLDRIVELIRRLRATEARRYTKLEIPFITGIRKDVAAVLVDLA
ncbi:MAG: hydrogen peroxide-dependent heme synthase [Actinomycetota bacterium]